MKIKIKAFDNNCNHLKNYTNRIIRNKKKRWFWHTSWHIHVRYVSWSSWSSSVSLCSLFSKLSWRSNVACYKTQLSIIESEIGLIQAKKIAQLKGKMSWRKAQHCCISHTQAATMCAAQYKCVCKHIHIEHIISHVLLLNPLREAKPPFSKTAEMLCDKNDKRSKRYHIENPLAIWYQIAIWWIILSCIELFCMTFFLIHIQIECRKIELIWFFFLKSNLTNQLIAMRTTKCFFSLLQWNECRAIAMAIMNN